MLHSLPRHTPALAVMLSDLGNPSPATLARALGISTRSAQRYITLDQAPRPVMLAIFWCTRWGRSQVDADAVNDARNAVGLAACLRVELQQLRAELARVVALGDFGCANGPSYAGLQHVDLCRPGRGDHAAVPRGQRDGHSRGQVDIDGVIGACVPAHRIGMQGAGAIDRQI